MTFSNPIMGGTDLIRSAVQSPNYDPGVVGWRIAKDGTAEFGNLIARGDLTGSTINGKRIPLGLLDIVDVTGDVTMGVGENSKVVAETVTLNFVAGRQYRFSCEWNNSAVIAATETALRLTMSGVIVRNHRLSDRPQGGYTQRTWAVPAGSDFLLSSVVATIIRVSGTAAHTLMGTLSSPIQLIVEDLG